MNSDALLVILLLASAAFILIVTTLGCVLLTKLFADKVSRGGRTVIAALSGCLVVIFPLILVAFMENSQMGGEAFAAIGMVLFFCMVVAWLPAHFATRRLDRLTEFDIETFT